MTKTPLYSAVMPPPEIRDLIWESELFENLVLNESGDLDIDRFVNLSNERIHNIANELVGNGSEELTSEDWDDKTLDREKRGNDIHLFQYSSLLIFLRNTLAASEKDGLTGLFNKKAFREALERKIKHLQEQNLLDKDRRNDSKFDKGTALLEVDLDRFKPFNDVLNYHIGDMAIIAAAKMLEEGRREQDIVARVGGDEYLLLISDVNEEEAEVITERLREKFKELYIEIDVNQSIKLTPNQCKMLDKEPDQEFKVIDLSVDEFRKLQMQIEFHDDKCKLFIGGSVGKAMLTVDKTREEIELSAGADRKAKKQYWDNAGREPTGP